MSKLLKFRQFLAPQEQLSSEALRKIRGGSGETTVTTTTTTTTLTTALDDNKRPERPGGGVSTH